MPLRVLLLLPDGEQPGVSSTTPGQTTSSKLPKSPTFSSFKRSLSPLGRVPSRLSDNVNSHSSKPLPSPPPGATSNRASNQTHLTLPSTSGSSAAPSSRNTEYVPSPPLTPSSTDSFAEATVRGLTLSPRKRTKPALTVNTRLPRTGKGIRYLSSPPSSGHSSCSFDAAWGGGVSEEEADEMERGTMRASTSKPNDHGAATARKAVEDRIQHLLATKGELHPQSAESPESHSDQTLSRMSYRTQGFSPSLPHSPLLNKRPPSRPGFPLPYPVIHLPDSPRMFNMTSGRRRLRSRQSNPPPPPTRALPPYKIFGPHEAVPLDIIGDPRKAKELPVRTSRNGWGPNGLLIRSTRSMKPKGVKGKYIRLVTLPPLPPPGVQAGREPDGDSLDCTPPPRGGRRKRNVRIPTLFVGEDGEDGSEDASLESRKNGSKSMRREKDIFTVYMTELVATQWNKPVPCMMWPPPAPPTAPSPPSRPPSVTSTRRPISSLSRLSTPSSASTRHILSPPTSAYQFPLPNLTPLQKASLHEAGLLVYAVPSGYMGAVPPPECVLIGEQAGVEEEEIVGPWVTAQAPKLHSLQAPFSARSPLSVNVVAANGGGGGMLSGGLSPRWPIEGLGLWSRAKGSGNARDSVASTALSGGKSPVHSRPSSGVVVQNSAEDSNPNDEPTAPSPTPTTATQVSGGWSSSLRSIRARAQEYYGKELSSTSPSLISLAPDGGLSTSQSEVLSMGSSKAASSTPMSRGGPLGTMTVSRSFGSLFVRAAASSSLSSSMMNAGDSPPSNALSASAAALVSGGTPSVSDSGSVSGSGTSGRAVLFEYVDAPRDGEVVKVEIVEMEDGNGNMDHGSAPPVAAVAAAKRWNLGGWSSRWGS